MQILLATSNEHKIVEIRAILEPQIPGLLIKSLQDFPDAASLPEPIEDAPTFAGNAKIKATYYAKATQQICLADDSGLIVDALNGAPGVHSARYAQAEVGEGEADRATRDNANNQKLLRELAKLNLPIEKHTARFACALCLIDGSNHNAILAETAGYFEGLITNQPAGTNGFGYDPLLYLPDVKQTSAQLTSLQKNQRSHRNAALQKLIQQLRT